MLSERRDPYKDSKGQYDSMMRNKIIANSNKNAVKINTMIEYIDMLFEIMGIDIDYKRFSVMSKEDKKSLMRDIKIKMILK